MADISVLKLPNNSTYTIKDGNAVESVSFSNHTLTQTKRNGTSSTVDLGTFDSLTTTSLTVNGVATIVTEIIGDLTGNADTATNATNDESGNNIKSNYMAALTVLNNVVSLLNKNNTSIGGFELQPGVITSAEVTGGTLNISIGTLPSLAAVTNNS